MGAMAMLAVEYLIFAMNPQLHYRATLRIAK